MELTYAQRFLNQWGSRVWLDETITKIVVLLIETSLKKDHLYCDEDTRATCWVAHRLNFSWSSTYSKSGCRCCSWTHNFQGVTIYFGETKRYHQKTHKKNDIVKGDSFQMFTPGGEAYSMMQSKEDRLICKRFRYIVLAWNICDYNMAHERFKQLPSLDRLPLEVSNIFKNTTVYKALSSLSFKSMVTIVLTLKEVIQVKDVRRYIYRFL